MASKFPSHSGNQRIDSWKEIAAFFGRDERTVKRWEKERGLPIHRIPGGSRGAVFAFQEELTAWLEARQESDMAASSDFGPAPGTHSEVSVAALPVAAEAEPPAPTNSSGNRTGWMVAVMVLILVAGLVGGLRYLRVEAGKAHSAANSGATTVARHEAEELYLQGRFYWNKRTPEGLTQSVDYFTKATQRDPTYALGYAGLADSYNLLREYTSMPGSEAFPLALAAAKKAVELDDNLPEAHRALAFVYFNWSWDIAGADREYRRAIELRPTDAQSHHWYATMLVELANYPQALEEIERARQLDPSSKSIAADRGFILCSAGRQEEGISALQALEKAEPGFVSPHSYLAGVYFDEKKYDKYFAESRTLATLAGSDTTAITRKEERFKKGGEAALLESVLSQQLDDFEKGRGGAYGVAETYADLGRKRESLEYLERAYQRREYVLVSLRNNQRLSRLSGEPEYQDLLKRVGLDSIKGN